MSQGKIAIASFLISLSVYTVNWVLFQIYSSKCLKWGFSGYLEGIIGVSNPHCQYIFTFLNRSLEIYVSLSVASSVSFIATIIVITQKLMEKWFSSETLQHVDLSIFSNGLNQSTFKSGMNQFKFSKDKNEELNKKDINKQDINETDNKDKENVEKPNIDKVQSNDDKEVNSE